MEKLLPGTCRTAFWIVVLAVAEAGPELFNVAHLHHVHGDQIVFLTRGVRIDAGELIARILVTLPSDTGALATVAPVVI